MKNIFIKVLAVAIIVIGSVIMTKPALAVTYKLIDLEASKLQNQGESCDEAGNTAKCPGMCAVAFKITSREGFLDLSYDHLYTFNVYNISDNRPLLKLQKVGATTEEAVLRLNFDKYANGLLCGMFIDGPDGVSADLASFFQNVGGSPRGQALARPPYCCCKPASDGKGGLTDCQASHDWKARYSQKFTDGITELVATCQSGYQVKSIQEKVEGDKKISSCDFNEGATAAQQRANQQAAEERGGNLDGLRDQLSVLNKFPQFDNVPADKLGSAIIGRFIGVPLGILLGSVSLALYIIAGFIWMTAAGNSEKTQQAQQMVVWTSLGVAAILASYILVRLVFQVTTTGSI